MTNRAVLVTGSARGLGRAIAARFAAGGDRVAVHYRESREMAESLVAELPGRGHLVVQADMADPEGVRAMVADAAAGLGRLDVLVNNAGIYGAPPAVPLVEAGYDEWTSGAIVDMNGASYLRT